MVSELQVVSYMVHDGWKTQKSSFFAAQRVDPKRNALVLTVRVPPEEKALEGGLVEVGLFFGEERDALTVPKSALLEEYGQYSVIEQISGESFVQRVVEIGAQHDEHVEIRSGLDEGDWVVSEGAYLVKMISMSSSVPAHGHTH